MFPVPLVPKPTLTEDVHEKLVPVTGPVKVIPVLEVPLHCILFAIPPTPGVGLTVTA
jgi:hypothetical protein